MEFSDDERREEIQPLSETTGEEILQSQPAIETPTQNVSVVEESDNTTEDEEDSTLAFPTARVVRILREEMRCGKQIRGEVKSAVNDWLGITLRKVAREMDKSPYGSIGIADFQRATKPYDMINHLVKDQERIMLAIEKLKHDADQIKRDLQRFYVNLTGTEQEEL